MYNASVDAFNKNSPNELKVAHKYSPIKEQVTYFLKVVSSAVAISLVELTNIVL